MDPEAGGLSSQVGAPMPDAHLPLIRCSHIFSSAVREVLEEKLLRELGSDGLTPRQLELLTFIALASHHVDDVARFLDVSAPAATRAVDALERRGLVSRRASATDRRLRLLCCSPKGRRLIARYRSLEAERLSQVLDEFSPEERARLIDLLERYSVALINAGGAAATFCLRCSGHFDPQCPIQVLCSECACRPRRRSNGG